MRRPKANSYLSSGSGKFPDLETPQPELESGRPFAEHRGAEVNIHTSVPDHVSEALAELFGALASPTRLRIFCSLLPGKDLNVTEVARACGASLSTVSHHFRRLREDRLVDRRKVGPATYYRISNDFFASLVSQAISWSARNPDLLPPAKLQIVGSQGSTVDCS
jgi:DNA-binding transcriptional ArsR family regulator